LKIAGTLNKPVQAAELRSALKALKEDLAPND
jgi:hypothetical protein